MRQLLATKFCLALALVCVPLCWGQQTSTEAPAPEAETTPVPVLSGYAAFVPIDDGGQPTLVSIISPVLLVPIGKKWLFESRAAFEGDFQRRFGNSGDFTGGIDKSLDYLELDYIANRYVTVSGGRYLIPFNMFNERLYPNWIRNTQTDPLIFPIGTGSNNGALVRGGFDLNKSVELNYAVYVSVLQTTDHFDSERNAGGRIAIFLPKYRLELGMSGQHQMQDLRINRLGWHMEWQPRSAPLDIRAEGAYSHEEGSGYWLEGAYRLSNAHAWQPVLRKTQLVVRTQLYHVGIVPGINDALPGDDTKRTEAGVNYYIQDGWKALVSYGRTFTPAGDSNIWTVGMTYRFVFPLGRAQ